MGDHVPADAPGDGRPSARRAGTPHALRRAERAENFPVALRVLPSGERDALRAVYDVLRTVDDLGDDPDVAPGDRSARLEEFGHDLARVWGGHAEPSAPVLRRLAPAVARHALPREPFEDLLAANQQDQRVSRYRTHAELDAYCRLSAVPVGRLVLAVFGVATDADVWRESDRVCTALQLLEHLQDVGEDRARGRVYLPADALARAGVAETDLDAATATPTLRALVRRESDRAAGLLVAGSPLVGRLHGAARLAVSGYVAGGLAAADAIRRTEGDVLGATARTRRRDVVRHAVTVAVRGRADPPPPDPALRPAYAASEAITRTQARNFSYGIRLLAPGRRAALSAVYALARRVDDVGDDPGPSADEKKTALEAVRRSLAELETTGEAPGDDPVLVALADTGRRHRLPLAAFGELVDGVEADVTADAAVAAGVGYRRHRTVDDMLVYCRQVAGSIGRLCLGVFGSRPHPDAERFADALGIALQQTNILRDIREDLLGGRVYLPTEDLERFGVDLALDRDGGLADPDGALAALVRASAERARGWYAEGLRLVPLLDRRSAACAVAMAGIYRRLLEEIAADPPSVYRQRRSLSGTQKAAVAARALSGRWRAP